MGSHQSKAGNENYDTRTRLSAELIQRKLAASIPGCGRSSGAPRADLDHTWNTTWG